MQTLSNYALYAERLIALHQDVCSAIETLAKQLTEPLELDEDTASVMYPDNYFSEVSFADGITVIALQTDYATDRTEYVPSEMDINDVLYVLEELENYFEQ